jgi:hypothetical protein
VTIGSYRGRRMATAPRLRAVAPLVLPPVGQVRLGDRARLTAEVVLTYLPLLRFLRRNDLPGMVATARSVRRTVEVRPGAEHDTAVRLGKIVMHVLRVFPTEKRCLIRSLVLVRMLAARSIPSTLVIGVQSEGGFAAHAWVEHEGRAVLPAGGYARLTEL